MLACEDQITQFERSQADLCDPRKSTSQLVIWTDIRVLVIGWLADQEWAEGNVFLRLTYCMLYYSGDVNGWVVHLYFTKHDLTRNSSFTVVSRGTFKCNYYPACCRMKTTILIDIGTGKQTKNIAYAQHALYCFRCPISTALLLIYVWNFCIYCCTGDSL